MTSPTRREHIAAIRERDWWATPKGDDPSEYPADRGSRQRDLDGLVADRRYLLGVVGELAAALGETGRFLDLWLTGDLDFSEYNVRATIARLRDFVDECSPTARALLADLGPDA